MKGRRRWNERKKMRVGYRRGGVGWGRGRGGVGGGGGWSGRGEVGWGEGRMRGLKNQLYWN